MEDTVTVRTAELKQANAALQAEVAERCSIEEALRQSEAEARKLALVAAHTRNGVILADSRGRIEWVNDAFTGLTGYGFAEIVGRTPGSVLQGPKTDPATVGLMRDRIHAGEGFAVEIQNYRKSGRPFWVKIEASAHPRRIGCTHAVHRRADGHRRAKCAEWRLTAQHDAMRVLAESTSFAEAIPKLLRAIGEPLCLDRGEYWRVDPARACCAGNRLVSRARIGQGVHGRFADDDL